MAKTITLRVDDSTYNTIKRAADGDRRSMSSLIEKATIRYIIDNAPKIDPADYDDDTGYLCAIPGMKEKLIASHNAPASEFSPVPDDWINRNV